MKDMRQTDDEQRQKIEKCVMGAILTEGNAAFNAAVELGIDTDSFTDSLCKSLWDVFSQMDAEGMQIDLSSMLPSAKKAGLAMSEIAKLTSIEYISASRHLATHCKLLNAFRLERMAYVVGMNLIAVSNDKEREHVVTEFEDAIRKYRAMATRTGIRHVSSVVKTAAMEVRERRRNFYSGELAGTNTGLASLNRMTNGWQEGTLNIVAARPGMGKTAMAVHFALSASKQGKNVCIFAMEMKAERIVDRMVLSITNLDGEKYRRGELTEDDICEFDGASNALAAQKIYIDDNSNCSVGYIHSTAKRMQDEGKCDIVIVDYLQLTDMAAGTSRTYTRENMVTAASRGFKVLAKDLKIPVLLLSQLNRAVEGRADKKPMLSDLRESGSIEQDADTVLFIHRPEYYNSEEGVVKNEYGEFQYGIGSVHLAKQREGGTGEVEFCYDRTLSKIWDNDSIS